MEEFVADAAIDLLGRLQVGEQPSAVAVSAADLAAVEADRVELAELADMWQAREITTREYRQMRKIVDERIDKVQAKTVVRPTAEVLHGLVGANARAPGRRCGTAARTRGSMRCCGSCSPL